MPAGPGRKGVNASGRRWELVCVDIVMVVVGLVGLALLVYLFVVLFRGER